MNYIPVALIIFSTFVSVYVGILMNRRDVNALREEMNRRFDQTDRRIDKVEHRLEVIEADQKQFFTVTG